MYKIIITDKSGVDDFQCIDSIEKTMAKYGAECFFSLDPEDVINCDGIILPGAPPDVDPALYGEEKEPGKAARILLLLGLFSMDIYILHEPIMTAVKLLLWNRLGWNYILCTFVIFVCALCLPIPISKWVIRKIKPLRILLLGER